MNNIQDVRRTSISSAKNVSNMDSIADDFAVVDTIESFHLFDFPTRLNELIFGICLSGTIEIEINLRKHTISANQLIVILPEQIIKYIHRSDDFSARFILMSHQFMEDSLISLQNELPLFLHIRQQPCIELTSDEMDVILEYFSLLQKKVRMTNSFVRREITQCLMQALFYEGGEICKKHFPPSETEKSRKEEVFERFVEQIQLHFKEQRTITFYANKLCLTPKYLSSAIKDVSGRLAGEWITDFVILEAKVLLKSSNKTIQQISEELNFVTQSRFGTYFKQSTGMSPREYKKK